MPNNVAKYCWLNNETKLNQLHGSVFKENAGRHRSVDESNQKSFIKIRLNVSTFWTSTFTNGQSSKMLAPHRFLVL